MINVCNDNRLNGMRACGSTDINVKQTELYCLSIYVLRACNILFAIADAVSFLYAGPVSAVNSVSRLYSGVCRFDPSPVVSFW